MSGKIIAVNPFFTEEMKEKIRAAAAANGYTALIFASDEQALADLKDAEAATAYGTLLTREGKSLKWFHSMSAGIDAYLQKGNIANPDMILTHSVGAYGVTLSEHTIMMLLMLLRRQMEYGKAAAKHVWLKRMAVKGIIGSRITILGTGDIGRSLAVRLRAFGPDSITGVNRSGRGDESCFDRIAVRSELPEVLERTDILIMALPGGDETWHYIGQEELSFLPQSAVLINVGRGSCLDTRALETVLREGKLTAAALDVFESEPLPEDDSLWECPNLLITPHMAGGPTLSYTLSRITDQFCENLARFAKGELKGVPFRN